MDLRELHSTYSRIEKKKASPRQMQSMMVCGDPGMRMEPGFERGCEGGRAFMAAKADGTYSPCHYLQGEPAASFALYGDNSDALKKHRASNHQTPGCDGCAYHHRCAPCPVVIQKKNDCTL